MPSLKYWERKRSTLHGEALTHFPLQGQHYWGLLIVDGVLVSAGLPYGGVIDGSFVTRRCDG